MKLTDLLTDIPHALIAGSADREITGIAYDSRKVTPGCLFVCLRGEQVDGHTFIPAALQAGAAAIVVEEAPAQVGEATLIQVADSRVALAHLSAAWFSHPARAMTMIGITGTKGKTTTTHMIKKILECSGQKVGMIGTIGAFIGQEKLPTKNTTPESYELHSLFAQMRHAGCHAVVMEVSSQGLKHKRTAGIDFDYGVFTNISPDHIGKGEHADFDEYLTCKSLLFRQAKKTVVNVDADHWQEVTAAAKAPITVSTRQGADYRSDHIEKLWEPGLLGTAFDLTGRAEAHIKLNMPGRFNVENALIAIAVTSDMGIEISRIQEALAQVSVRGRTQVLKEASRSAVFLIDYAHNALSIQSLLETLMEYEPKRLICLFGGGGNRPKQRRYDMGSVAGKYAQLTVLTMDNPRDEDMAQINADIIEGLNVHHGVYKIIDDREDAIRYLLESCGEGDMVAFIGKGHEEYQEIRGIKHPFSEVEVVERWVAEQKAKE